MKKTWGSEFFVSAISTFRSFWPTSSGPGPTLLDGSVSLKFLETRLKYGSFKQGPSVLKTLGVTNLYFLYSDNITMFNQP